MTSVPASSASTFSCRLSWSAETRSPGNGGLSPSPNHPQLVSNRAAPNARTDATRRRWARTIPRNPLITTPTRSVPDPIEHLLGPLREARSRRGLRIRRLLQGLKRRLGLCSVAGRHRREAGDFKRRQAIGLAFLGQILDKVGGGLGLADFQLQQRRLDQREVAQGLVGAAVLGDLAQDAASLGLVAALDRGLGQTEARQHAVDAALRRDLAQRCFARLQILGRRRAQEVRRGLELLVG